MIIRDQNGHWIKLTPEGWRRISAINAWIFVAHEAVLTCRRYIAARIFKWIEPRDLYAEHVKREIGRPRRGG